MDTRSAHSGDGTGSIRSGGGTDRYTASMGGGGSYAGASHDGSNTGVDYTYFKGYGPGGAPVPKGLQALSGKGVPGDNNKRGKGKNGGEEGGGGAVVADDDDPHDPTNGFIPGEVVEKCAVVDDSVDYERVCETACLFIEGIAFSTQRVLDELEHRRQEEAITGRRRQPGEGGANSVVLTMPSQDFIARNLAYKEDVWFGISSTINDHLSFDALRSGGGNAGGGMTVGPSDPVLGEYNYRIRRLLKLHGQDAALADLTWYLDNFKEKFAEKMAAADVTALALELGDMGGEAEDFSDDDEILLALNDDDDIKRKRRVLAAYAVDNAFEPSRRTEGGARAADVSKDTLAQSLAPTSTSRAMREVSYHNLIYGGLGGPLVATYAAQYEDAQLDNQTLTLGIPPTILSRLKQHHNKNEYLRSLLTTFEEKYGPEPPKERFGARLKRYLLARRPSLLPKAQELLSIAFHKYARLAAATIRLVLAGSAYAVSRTGASYLVSLASHREIAKSIKDFLYAEDTMYNKKMLSRQETQSRSETYVESAADVFERGRKDRLAAGQGKYVDRVALPSNRFPVSEAEAKRIFNEVPQSQENICDTFHRLTCLSKAVLSVVNEVAEEVYRQESAELERQSGMEQFDSTVSPYDGSTITVGGIRRRISTDNEATKKSTNVLIAQFHRVRALLIQSTCGMLVPASVGLTDRDVYVASKDQQYADLVAAASPFEHEDSSAVRSPLLGNEDVKANVFRVASLLLGNVEYSAERYIMAEITRRYGPEPDPPLPRMDACEPLQPVDRLRQAMRLERFYRFHEREVPKMFMGIVRREERGMAKHLIRYYSDLGSDFVEGELAKTREAMEAAISEYIGDVVSAHHQHDYTSVWKILCRYLYYRVDHQGGFVSRDHVFDRDEDDPELAMLDQSMTAMENSSSSQFRRTRSTEDFRAKRELVKLQERKEQRQIELEAKRAAAATANKKETVGEYFERKMNNMSNREKTLYFVAKDAKLMRDVQKDTVVAPSAVLSQLQQFTTDDSATQDLTFGANLLTHINVDESTVISPYFGLMPSMKDMWTHLLGKYGQEPKSSKQRQIQRGKQKEAQSRILPEKEKLKKFYAYYAPTKNAADIDAALKQFRNKVPVMWAVLEKKYGPLSNALKHFRSDGDDTSEKVEGDGTEAALRACRKILLASGDPYRQLPTIDALERVTEAQRSREQELGIVVPQPVANPFNPITITKDMLDRYLGMDVECARQQKRVQIFLARKGVSATILDIETMVDRYKHSPMGFEHMWADLIAEYGADMDLMDPDKEPSKAEQQLIADLGSTNVTLVTLPTKKSGRASSSPPSSPAANTRGGPEGSSSALVAKTLQVGSTDQIDSWAKSRDDHIQHERMENFFDYYSSAGVHFMHDDQSTERKKYALHTSYQSRRFHRTHPTKTRQEVLALQRRYLQGAAGGYERMWIALEEKYGPQPPDTFTRANLEVRRLTKENERHIKRLQVNSGIASNSQDIYSVVRSEEKALELQRAVEQQKAAAEAHADPEKALSELKQGGLMNEGQEQQMLNFFLKWRTPAGGAPDTARRRSVLDVTLSPSPRELRRSSRAGEGLSRQPLVSPLSLGTPISNHVPLHIFDLDVKETHLQSIAAAAKSGGGDASKHHKHHKGQGTTSSKGMYAQPRRDHDYYYGTSEMLAANKQQNW